MVITSGSDPEDKGSIPLTSVIDVQHNWECDGLQNREIGVRIPTHLLAVRTMVSTQGFDPCNMSSILIQPVSGVLAELVNAPDC